jgi:hypothetical protein
MYVQPIVTISKELNKFIPSLKRQINDYITKNLHPHHVSFFGVNLPIVKFNYYVDFQSIPEYEFKYGDFWLNIYPQMHNGEFHLNVEYHFNDDMGQYQERKSSNSNKFEKEFKDATIRLEIEMKKIKLKHLFINNNIS